MTKSGSTARNVSKFRPPTPILATTTERSVARRLQLVWGVTPIVVKNDERTAKTFSLAMQFCSGDGNPKSRRFSSSNGWNINGY